MILPSAGETMSVLLFPIGNELDASVEDGHLIAGAFDYTEEVESPIIQSQFVNLDGDTEELDIPHFVGDLRALMVDDSDDEVVLDSDDEVIPEPKEGRIRGLWRRASAVSTPSFEVRSSAGSNLTEKVSDNDPSSVRVEARYQEVLVGRSKERNLVSDDENVAMVDPDWCGRQCKEDNIGSKAMETKVLNGDEFVNLKVPSVDFKNANGEVNGSAMISDNKLALGCYNESQEPGESSQANALDFVDHYLSVSVVNSSPEVRIPKFDGLRSPLASGAKGSQNLAMKANRMTKIGISTFEWDDDQPDHGGELFLKKKKELDIQREKHSGGRCKEGLQELVLVDSKRAFSCSVVQNSNPISKVLQTDETERGASRVNEFEQFEEESSKQLPGNDSNERDEPEMFDVGFDTQMAAEAMEALLYLPPPSIDANEDEGLKVTPNDTKKTSKQFSFSLRADCDSQIDGISFKQKRITNQRHQMSTFLHKNSHNQRESYLELPNVAMAARGESSTENRMDGNNLSEPKKKAHKKYSKVVSRKKQKQDSDKENVRGGYRKRGLVKLDKCDPLGGIQQEVKTFSPVACRTRRGSSIKRSKRTEDTTCNPGYIRDDKQVDVLHKRKLGDLDTNFLLRKRTKCSTSDSCELKEATKRELFQKWPGHLDAATTSGHLKLDTWKWPKKKRTCRNMRQNTKLSKTFYVLSSIVGSGNGNLVMGPSETEGNFKEAFLMSSVKRKARSTSKYRSTSRKNLLKGLSIQKSGQPSLADITNTKSDLMSTKMNPEALDQSEASSQSRKLIDEGSIPSSSGEEKMKDLFSKRKSRKSTMVSSVVNRKQLCKKNSASSSLQNESTRLGFAESLPDFCSKDLRRRRSKVEIRVLFSQSLDDDVVKQLRKIMTKLGISLATDCSDATHFVSDRFARTKKMLEAMAFGKPVVTPLWLESCEQAKCIVDEKNYILRDAKKEKEIGFSMPISLNHARAYPLLKDLRVFITPNVEPDREMIENLVKAVHGQVMENIQQASMECKISDDLIILSCEEDYEVCVPFLDKGAAVYSSELLLNGIIIQKLEYVRHQLFQGHVKMKRYARKKIGKAASS
ncbi:hypothetical protein L6452_38291 [Arctium lappa]|uniref:Uncharacterized protein n=1 Tax=Arctium lappa TaxID=4217 RepID=A0ACB8Y4Q0_ARCLA|nr:hypothetical protein L6452_38291 [Arctium lappa]